MAGGDILHSIGMYELDARLVWGLFIRGLGLVLFIAFASLSTQVLPHAGRNGVFPVQRLLSVLRRDFSPLRRWCHFPTLLWLNASDGMLQALPLVGMLAAALVICGGPVSVLGLLLCYLCLLSLDLALALIFPWDCVLFESTLLALFLPATAALPELRAVAPAPASIAWAYRLLVFRLMFGFGKQKFLGSRRRDLAYLQGFLVNQPLPSKLGWYAQKLPLPLLRLALCAMFVVEVPLPFCAFLPGPLSVVCCVGTVVLMVGIQLMGNFGYFSLVTSVLCLTLLDNETPRTAFWAAGGTVGAVLANGYVVLHSVCAAFALLFNSWLGQSFHLWAFWYQLPRSVQPFFELLRSLHPFRWLHPYGVFPPNNTPGVKMSLLFEATWDRETGDRAHWHELEFPLAPCRPESAPRFIAPHHPRGDQALIYDTFGLNATSLMNGVIGVYSPYPFASRAPLSFFCQAILRGEGHAFVRGPALAQHRSPPLGVRVTTQMLEPVSLRERRETGRWWRRRYVGPHVPPQPLDTDFWTDALGEPELWHFEAIAWRRRSRLNRLAREARRSAACPLEIVLGDAPELTALDVERFWAELVPLVGSPRRESLDHLPEAVAELAARFSRSARRNQYRLLGRFAWCLVARLEPLFLHRGRRPLIAAPTYFHLWMLAHHIIGCGRSAYLAAFAEPLSAGAYLEALTPATGLFALGLFRFEELHFEAQKLRLIEAFTYPHDPAAKRANAERLAKQDFSELPRVERSVLRTAFALSGFFHVLPAIRNAFRGPRFERGYPERYPVFVELDSGVVREADAGDSAVTSETSSRAPEPLPKSATCGSAADTDSSCRALLEPQSSLTRPVLATSPLGLEPRRPV